MKRRRPDPSPSESLFARIFGLDLRSLAAFRIGIALFVLYDLLSRSFDLTAHYTDAGTMPRVLAAYFYSINSAYQSWSPVPFSIHMLTGSVTGIAAIFAVHAIFAIALLFGYRTRLMTVIVWFLQCSLQIRNPLVLSGADQVVRVFLFFAMFLPLGARYSLDAALNSSPGKAEPDLYATPSSAALYIQFICIYFFTALLKTGPEWRSEGTAVYYALSIDQYVLPLGKWLLQFPGLMKVLTFAVWWLELAGSFIFLIPSPLAKGIGVLLFGCLYLGFGVTLALGHFPWVNGIALLPFIPGAVWNRIHDQLAKARPRVEVIYDGECSFCRKMVVILSEFMSPRWIQAPRAAQGNDLVLLRRENSWIVRNEAGADFFRVDGFIQLASSSVLFFWAAPLLRLRPVRFVGDAKYRFIASHRPALSKLLLPLQFRASPLRRSWWREAVASFFLAAILLYNLAAFLPNHGPSDSLSNLLEFPALTVRLEQTWMMFAPAPNRDDGWFVIEGWLRDGSTIDAFREKPILSFEKPKAVPDFYPNERWRRYMMHIAERDWRDFRAPLAHYLCQNWNEKNTGSSHMDRLSIFFMQEQTPPPGDQGDVKKLALLPDYSCH